MNGINILLVSSNSQYCQEAQLFFARSNYELNIAENLFEALESIAKIDFAVVICQLRASSIDGFNLLEQLQQKPKTAKIPFILLADSFSSQEHRQAMEMGADDILFLPYSFLDIEGIIATRLSKNQALIKDSQTKLEELRYNITNFLPHEMRTALTGIIAASELLHKKYKTLESFAIEEMLSCIYVSGKKLSHLTHNFLLYSELKSLATDESQIHSLRQNSTVEIKQAIAKIVAHHSKNYARQSDITLNFKNLDLICVQIGSTNFTKLVSELVDNACKFSPEGTPITINATIKGDRFVLAIANCGRGMTDEQITNIGLGMQFERSTYEQQGFGLGLTIARDLAQLHGGNLSIDSIINRETLVKVTLPLVNKERKTMTVSSSLKSNSL